VSCQTVKSFSFRILCSFRNKVILCFAKGELFTVKPYCTYLKTLRLQDCSFSVFSKVSTHTDVTFLYIFSGRQGISHLKERTWPSDNMLCRFIRSVVPVISFEIHFVLAFQWSSHIACLKLSTDSREKKPVYKFVYFVKSTSGEAFPEGCSVAFRM
jgi:hypothetical protein